MEDDLHPQCAELLSRLSPSPGSFSPEAAREGHAALARWICGPAPEIAAVEDLVLPAGQFAEGLRSPAGEVFDARRAPAVVLRRYVPRETGSISGEAGPAASTRAPGSSGTGGAALVFFHGGGWVQGTLDTYDTLCRALALACDSQVFSVDYRLSPESRFPDAILDCVRALRFVMEEGGRFGVDRTKVAIAGDSAGGHLAVTAARWLKAQDQPLPAGMALIYPVADRRLDSASARQFGEGYYLSRAQMEWFWQQFTGDDGPEPTDPDLSPALATDLAGLPPAFVLTAGCDILRDEGEVLAQRLNEQGVPAEVLRMPGMLHGFIRFGAVVDDAERAVQAVADAVRRWTTA
jgi:acetyl esterase